MDAFAGVRLPQRTRAQDPDCGMKASSAEARASTPPGTDGSSDPRNLVAACVDCNREKGTMTGNEDERYLRQSASPPVRRSSSGGLGDLVRTLAVVADGLLLLKALSGNRRA